MEPAALAELTNAQQLGSDQDAVKQSVKEYYGEVSERQLYPMLCTVERSAAAA